MAAGLLLLPDSGDSLGQHSRAADAIRSQLRTAMLLPQAPGTSCTYLPPASLSLSLPPTRPTCASSSAIRCSFSFMMLVSVPAKSSSSAGLSVPVSAYSTLGLLL